MAISTDPRFLGLIGDRHEWRKPELERSLLRIGFVNNMPDSAFEDTYQQFAFLTGADTHCSPIELRCYYIPTVPRKAEVLPTASVAYRDIEALYGDPPDALIITGTEPHSSNLRDEPYWYDLANLLRWAEAFVPSTLLSCLASHAAALALDGIDRSRLPAKQSGVFQQTVDRAHPLAHRLGSRVAFPHSRYNEIPTDALRARGYQLVIASMRTGWTVATRETAGRALTLLQGHPEYGPMTLLKEYRRDVRRFLDGSIQTHPQIPVDYLDREGVELLQSFRSRCEREGGKSGENFPFYPAAGHIRARWDRQSRQLFENWMADVRRRTTVSVTP
jgi:homoserine O-succinyltransferase